MIVACRSLSQAAELFGLHWDRVQRLIDQAGARGLARRTTEGLRRVGLDEKSFLRGQSFVSLLTDLEGQSVLEVRAGRDTQTCVRLWEALPEDQRVKVEAAAMDMGAPFIIGTRQAAPQADIVHDRFHMSKPLNEAVDQTRREESATLVARCDDTLKHTRWFWLHGRTPEDHKERFEALETNLGTARAPTARGDADLRRQFAQLVALPDATTPLQSQLHRVAFIGLVKITALWVPGLVLVRFVHDAPAAASFWGRQT